MAKGNKIKLIEKSTGRPIADILRQLFAECNGNQTRMAEALGVTQGTVSLWMLRTGLRTKRVIVEVEKL